MRRGTVRRATKETEVRITVNLEGRGRSECRTGVKFLNHMLDSFATHSLIDIKVRAKGDLQHHIVEDVAITLGQAVSKALGDRRGIRRFGGAAVPMDEALALAAVDLVRRPYASVQLALERVMVEDTPREDLEHFLVSLITNLDATVHLKVLDGRNDHHKFEATVKAFALALREATALDSGRSKKTPSSKGAM